MFIAQQQAQSIVDEMKAAIRHDINIMDESGVILASTNAARQGTIHHGALRIIQEGLTSLTIWENEPSSGVQTGINLPITMDGRTVGVIGITGDPQKVCVFGDIIKRMTEIMMESVRHQEQAALMDQAKSLFVDNWLFAQQVDWRELEIRGQLLGFDIKAPYTVALLQLTEEGGGCGEAGKLGEMRSNLIRQMVQNRLPEGERHFCAVIRNRIMVLLCRSGRTRSQAKINQICRDIEGYYQVRMSGGISDATKTPADIRRCYLEAHTACAIAVQSASHRVVFYDDVSLEFIVQSIPMQIRSDLRQLVLGECTQEDRREFVQTVETYFEQEGDLKRCAEKLFIHRNTFQYHIDRLKKHTGYNLRSPKDAILLYMAVKTLTEQSVPEP